MVDWGRLGAGVLTGGASELVGYDNAKNFLFGGDATKGLETRPGQYGQATGLLGDAARNAQGRVAPQVQAQQLGSAAQLAGGPQDQARLGLQGVAGRLGGIAAGQQVGAGEMAVNRQITAAQAAQQAQARSARGANAALAARNAARNTADLGVMGAGQAAQAQLQDQQAANAQLGQIYGSMRGQDIDLASQNAQLAQQQMLQQGQLGQQAGLANQSAQLQQQQLNDARQLAALGQMLGWDQATFNNELAKRGLAAQDKGMAGDLLQAGGTILASKSDRRLKTAIKDAEDEADELMGSLRAYSYRYKDAADGKGRRLGIMAQDLQKSKLGNSTVVKVDDKDHLGFDIGKAASAALASVARLHERLRKIEER